MRRRWPLAAAVLAGVLVLTACAQESAPPDAPAVHSVDPAPVSLGESAAPSDLPADAVPEALTGLPILDPGWDQVPQERDGLLLGLVHPADDARSGEPIRFVAAHEDGTLLWQAERPPSCTGHALSRSRDGVVAVLTDVVPGTDVLSQTLATGYDLATGQVLWGPLPVPGPHQGPGAVFATPAPGAAMGDTGPRTALDASTGEVVATEEDGIVVGEYDGVVLIAADGVLTAAGTHEWSAPLAELGLDPEPAALPGRPPDGTALVAARGERAGVLLDLRTGEVLADDVHDAAREPLSDTLVTAGPEYVSGYPGAGEPWQIPLPEARIQAAGNVLAYLRTGQQVRVVNAVTGADAVAFDDDVARPAVPVLVTRNGAVVVEGDELGLVPTRPHP